MSSGNARMPSAGIPEETENQAILPYSLLFSFAIPLLRHAVLPEVLTQCFVRVSCSAFWGGDEALRQRVSKHGKRAEPFALKSHLPFHRKQCCARRKALFPTKESNAFPADNVRYEKGHIPLKL